MQSSLKNPGDQFHNRLRHVAQFVTVVHVPSLVEEAARQGTIIDNLENVRKHEHYGHHDRAFHVHHEPS